MESHVPDVEMFIVFKWMVVLMISAAVAKFASLMVTKWWYGSDKHDRREDTDETRGWIQRFLDQQKESTEATVMLHQEMHAILDALQSNGKAIRDFTEEARCKYEGHRR